MTSSAQKSAVQRFEIPVQEAWQAQCLMDGQTGEGYDPWGETTGGCGGGTGGSHDVGGGGCMPLQQRWESEDAVVGIPNEYSSYCTTTTTTTTAMPLVDSGRFTEARYLSPSPSFEGILGVAPSHISMTESAAGPGTTSLAVTSRQMSSLLGDTPGMLDTDHLSQHQLTPEFNPGSQGARRAIRYLSCMTENVNV